MPRALSDVVSTLRADPATTAICLDFDGTLAPIVDDPAAATALPDSREVLGRLARIYRVVAVVSGRPVRFLHEQLGDGPTLVGLYGLERIERGQPVELAAAVGWRPVIAEVVAAASRELPSAVTVEDKGLSVTLHYRTASECAGAVADWAEVAAGRWGLERREARMSLELHPAVAVDKGTIVGELLNGCRAACFIGDDVGDLPAFEAVAAFSDRGGDGRRIVVSSTEMAAELVTVADLIVRDPAAVLELLRSLDPDTPAGSGLIG